jgi:hypothetical protein
MGAPPWFPSRSTCGPASRTGTAEGSREARDGVLRTTNPEIALPLADLFNPASA